MREIDHYLQQYVRYIPTGCFNGGNYRLNYQSMKTFGYRSLVHEYYADRKMRACGTGLEARGEPRQLSG
ncbi:MAG TPA: hypothetical protein DEB24_02135 [Coriobacteriia bacterium]|nr:hypothetical protein [Coriobacteriia bacterium]